MTASSGRVYLVGAGPGDPGLITLAGVERLREADVVLYDYLANPRLLEHARQDATLICMGKHGQGKIWSQREINEALVEYARAGKTVVRLKGGDPAVFARGAEEAETLAAAGIPFQIVPGITAALAASSFAGIPITHRDLASAVALVTGQERIGKPGGIDFEALARFPGTLVFYMGVTTADQWTTSLIAAGKPPQTPAAIVRRCSLPDQYTETCTLEEVAECLGPPDPVRPPVVVIVGPVVSLSPVLSWFEKRRLFGQTIAVTRPAHQCDELRRRFEQLGANVVIQPAIEIAPPADMSLVDAALRRLSDFAWLAFSSANGVRFALNRLLELGFDARQLGGVRLAAVGRGTARTLEQQFQLQCDLIPEVFEGGALASALAPHVQGARVLLPRASRGRDILPRELASAGATVEEVVVYESRDISEAQPEVTALLAAGGLQWMTVTSSAIARSLVNLFGDQLRQVKLASISPITSQTLRELGFEPTVEAGQYDMDGVVEAVCQAVDVEDAS